MHLPNFKDRKVHKCVWVHLHDCSPKWGLLPGEFVAFQKANSFLQKLTLKKGGKTENDRDSFPENVYIHLTNENIYIESNRTRPALVQDSWPDPTKEKNFDIRL